MALLCPTFSSTQTLAVHLQESEEESTKAALFQSLDLPHQLKY